MRAPERLASTIEALYASGSLEMLGMSSRESPNIDVAQPRHAIAVTAFLRSANNVTRVLTDSPGKNKNEAGVLQYKQHHFSCKPHYEVCLIGRHRQDRSR